MKAITVVMPALNEQAAVKDAVMSTLAAFKRLSIDGEVVIVNDGSTDATEDIARELAVEKKGTVKLVEHEVPMGVGKSFFDGVRIAEGEGVLMLPGDNENDPEEILRYSGLLASVDIVNPYVVNKEVRPLFRNVLSWLFTRIINVTFRTSFRYTNGTVIYRTSVLNGIECHSQGFFFQAEALVKAVKKGYLLCEVPYFLSERKGGVSKAVSLSSLKKVIKGYFGLIKDIYFSPRPKAVPPDSRRHTRGPGK